MRRKGLKKKLTSRLFSLRAESLINATPGAELRVRLSGMLIAAELAGCCEFWSDKAVILVGGVGPDNFKEWLDAEMLPGFHWIFPVYHRNCLVIRCN